MCACKEIDVRESLNDSTFAGGEGQVSRGEMQYAAFEESPVSSLPERGVVAAYQNISLSLQKTEINGEITLARWMC
jgi:hypothetical protein